MNGHKQDKLLPLTKRWKGQEERDLSSSKDIDIHPPIQPAELTLPLAEMTIECQELNMMQQAFKSIEMWNNLQIGREIECLTFTKDFLDNFPNVTSKLKLQMHFSL